MCHSPGTNRLPAQGHPSGRSTTGQDAWGGGTSARNQPWNRLCSSSGYGALCRLGDPDEIAVRAREGLCHSDGIGARDQPIWATPPAREGSSGHPALQTGTHGVAASRLGYDCLILTFQKRPVANRHRFDGAKAFEDVVGKRRSTCGRTDPMKGAGCRSAAGSRSVAVSWTAPVAVAVAVAASTRRAGRVRGQGGNARPDRRGKSVDRSCQLCDG